MVEPGRNPLIDHNASVGQPGRRPETFTSKVSSGFSSAKTAVSSGATRVANSEAYGKVKQGAGVAWDKTKSVSVAAAHAAKPAAIATKNAAVSLFDKAKNAFSSKKTAASLEESNALIKAQERIKTLEAELLEKDRILEVVMCDHDRDIDDLRKSFEMGKPPLGPSANKQQHDQTRWSMDSVNLHEQSEHGACKECAVLKKQLRAYKKQWAEINRNFKQVPSLLESMITRTDNLVTNITKLSN